MSRFEQNASKRSVITWRLRYIHSLFLFVSMLFSTFPSFPLESLSVCVCMGVCISHPVERFHAPRILLGGCHACTCLDQAASCVDQFIRVDLMGLVRVECCLSSLVLLKKKGISDRWGRPSQIGFLCASIDASPSMKPVWYPCHSLADLLSHPLSRTRLKSVWHCNPDRWLIIFSF